MWPKSPNNAIFRNKRNKKWFAVLFLDFPQNLFKSNKNERKDVINLKADPMDIANLIDEKNFFPAYHMNKEHWVSVTIDENLSLHTLISLVDISYNIVDN